MIHRSPSEVTLRFVDTLASPIFRVCHHENLSFFRWQPFFGILSTKEANGLLGKEQGRMTSTILDTHQCTNDKKGKGFSKTIPNETAVEKSGSLIVADHALVYWVLLDLFLAGCLIMTEFSLRPGWVDLY